MSFEYTRSLLLLMSISEKVFNCDMVIKQSCVDAARLMNFRFLCLLHKMEPSKSVVRGISDKEQVDDSCIVKSLPFFMRSQLGYLVKPHENNTEK